MLEQLLLPRSVDERIDFLTTVFGKRINELILSGREMVFVYDFQAGSSVPTYEALQFAIRHYPFHVRTLARATIASEFAAHDGCLVEIVAALTLAHIRRAQQRFKVVVRLMDPVEQSIRRFVGAWRTQEGREYGELGDYRIDANDYLGALNPRHYDEWLEREAAVIADLALVKNTPPSEESSFVLAGKEADILVLKDNLGEEAVSAALTRFTADDGVRVLDSDRFRYNPLRQLLQEFTAALRFTPAQLEEFYRGALVNFVFTRREISAWQTKWSRVSDVVESSVR